MALRAHHFTIALVAAVALGAPAAARAQTSIDQVAASLRSDPVYVDPQARSVLSQEAERRVEDEIRTKDPGPMYVAVLPASASNAAGGSASGVVVQLYRALGQRQGTYVASVGRNLSAASQGVLRPGVASQLRADAISAHKGDGLGPILVDFVDRAAEARANGGRAPSSGGGGGGGGGGLLGVLAVIVAGGGLFAFFRRRRRRREEQAQVEELRDAARDDLVALGDDVRAIDIPIEQRDADPRAREALGVALQRYEEAETALDRARRPEDFEPIAQALEDGRFQMEVAKARLERRPPPERRPPCFFDPRHGPSVRDVEWAPPGGQPRPVPACAADAVRVESGEEPAMREVLAGGSRMPYWQAPGFGPWAGGFYGGYGGGLLPGLLVGTLLGGSLFGPAVAYGGGFGDGGFGDGGFGEGGDFGGGDQGDFGDADFGSQDWGGGGGDFGGGDFGGGGGDF